MMKTLMHCVNYVLRDIQTVVSIQSADIVQPPEGSCSVLLIETLPSGLYVDTFQLDSVAAFGGPQVHFSFPEAFKTTIVCPLLKKNILRLNPNEF